MNKHADALICKFGLGFEQTFQHKRVMARIGIWITACQSETHCNRLTEFIGLCDGKRQGMVIVCALRLLHPVKDIPAFSDTVGI